MENQLFVLVVEERPLVQTFVEDCLSEGGFEIVVTPSGEKAIELLDAAEGKYRALVTDINLGSGELDGWDVARHAREIDAHFPVVYMSGIESDEWASWSSQDFVDTLTRRAAQAEGTADVQIESMGYPSNLRIYKGA